MLTEADLRKLYENTFKDVVLHENYAEMYDPIYYFMNNEGKRIRPLLVLHGCNTFGGDINNALNPAFAVQMFHNFTLVHDDIMDEADLRRGQQTVHKIYGHNQAILAGDIILILAYKFLTQTETKNLPALLDVFNQTAIQIMEGQQMDMEFEERLMVSEQEYLTMIEYKTSVLLAASLKIGAIIANTSEEHQNLIYKFGRDLGLAFQLKDDYLDSFGDSAKTGKKVGGDIVQNKKTFLFVRALSKADNKTKSAIKDLLVCEDENKKISEMLSIYKALKVDEENEALMTQYFEKSLKNLESINVDDDHKKPLHHLAHKIFQRDH